MFRIALVVVFVALAACTRRGPNFDRIERERTIAKYGGVRPVDSLVLWSSGLVPRRFDYLKNEIGGATWIAWSGEDICVIPDWMVPYIERKDRPACAWLQPRGV